MGSKLNNYNLHAFVLQWTDGVYRLLWDLTASLWKRCQKEVGYLSFLKIFVFVCFC